MAQRSIEAEKNALKTYQGIYKKNPTSSDDWTNLHKLAYPGGIPDELRQATGTTDTTKLNAPLSQTVEGSNLGKLQDDVETAKVGVDKMSQPNEALRILQDAIRTKSDIGNQPLGTSAVFKEAGLTGMASLNASLNETSNKFKDDFTNFSNTVSQMTGQYKDMANMALQKYDMAYKEFTDESDRLQKIKDNLTDHSQALELLNQQYENSLKLKQYELANPDISDIIRGMDAGLENVDGEWLGKDRNIITSPSGNSYDWSTYNAVGTPKQQADYIQSVQDHINSVGKLNNEEELKDYIAKNMTRDSGIATLGKINAQDVMDISSRTGVGWEEILGLMKKESESGLSNVAMKNNNFGGITWTPTYQESHPNVTKGTARPASEGGNYVKFPTVKDGLMAQAEQFVKRKVASAPTTTNTPSILDIDMIEQMYYKGGTQAERDARRKEISEKLKTMTTEEYIANNPIGDTTKWKLNSQIFAAIAEYKNSGEWDNTSIEDRQQFILANGGDPSDFQEVLY